MTRTSTRAPRRPRGTLRLLVAGLIAVSVAACQQSQPAAPAIPSVATPPHLSVSAGARGLVDWRKPLTIDVSDGELTGLEVFDDLGIPLTGQLSPQEWRSTDELKPSYTYHVIATAKDAAGRSHDLTLTARTSRATKVLTAMHTPGSDIVMGIGVPAIITLNRPVTDPADRAAVVAAITVTTTPAVDGAWRWMSPVELHYRGPTYWTKGTVIHVHSDLNGLKLSQGVWGSGVVDTTFRIGSAVIATVDVATKRMTVVVDGKLVRTVKVSTGRDKYPTKGGVHIVLEKVKVEVMDSQTVGIPRNSPDGYYEKVPNSVRISYGGAFVHSASWSVRDQGVRNVSHGCVNISPADAAWFFGLVKRGDIVNIIHAKAPPLLSDPGMSDWNIPFSEWAN